MDRPDKVWSEGDRVGSAIIFFCSENSPRKKLSEVFQKIFRSVSEACRNFTKPGLYETLEQFPFPRSVSEHFQRISPGAQKCFSGGGIFRFPKRSGRVSLGFRFDPPWLFNVISNAGPCVVIMAHKMPT